MRREHGFRTLIVLTSFLLLLSLPALAQPEAAPTTNSPLADFFSWLASHTWTDSDSVKGMSTTSTLVGSDTPEPISDDGAQPPATQSTATDLSTPEGDATPEADPNG